MKKTMVFLMVALTVIVIQSNTIAFAESEARIIMVDDAINVEYLECDVSPIVENGSTLIPLRAIAEKLNFCVIWNESQQSIKIYNNDKSLELTIGSTVAIANSKSINMTIAPQIVNNRTFIPLRYVSEFFGMQVTWLKGIDFNYYIWVSSVALLRDEDVNVPEDDNYYVLSDDPIPYYALKPDGQTARGIQIGDDYDKVIEKYGKAHKLYIYNDEITIHYYSPGFPNTGSGSDLSFDIKNNKVCEVNIDPPN